MNSPVKKIFNRAIHCPCYTVRDYFNEDCLSVNKRNGDEYDWLESKKTEMSKEL